jgi:CBS domain-containing protein
VHEFWHPVIGALIFASIGLAVPRALGVGYDVIGDLLANRIATGTVAVLVVAKLFAWWAALGSGTSGGTLAPILLISAGYGCLFGTAVQQLAPDLGVAPGAFAVVAMAATFGSATRATFTAMVFVFELTRDYQVIVPLMIATVIADLVVETLLRDGLMTEKLTRRGLRVHTDYEVDPFRTVPVSAIMTTAVETLRENATVGTARRRFASGRHGAYPIVDHDRRCVGIVARHDLLREGLADSDRLIDWASRDVVTVKPDDLAVTALQRILEEDVEHIPVIDDGRLVGICTRTDLFKVRAPQFDAERHQPGWRRRNGGSDDPQDSGGSRRYRRIASRPGMDGESGE